MFTGRIGELGAVEQIEGDVLRVRAPKSASRVHDGGSACVNGVRLTVRPVDDVLEAVLSAETRRRSTFDTLGAGDAVNVETPLQVGDPLDGHLVQGYVDAVGKVIRIDDEGGSRRIWLRPPQRLLDRLLAKSPIALDGVSVTIAEVLRDRISVVLLPMTRSVTTLGGLEAGDRVNLELDLVGRLVEKAPPSAVGKALPQLPWAGRVDGRAGVEKVLRQLAAGGGVIVWDPETEGEGDVIFAGTRLRPESFTFLLTQVCGFPAVPCAPEVLRRLEIAQMPGEGDRQGTAWSIPVDLSAGTGTGVSAAERAATVRKLADPNATAGDFLRPGHVFPLAARPGLLAERSGHTEATVALCVAAGLPPVGVCCEVMNPDGTMAGSADLEVAALRWGMPMVDLADLKAWL
ncbi:3,4-dihydroxy-2-butanone 4-phosphate synthase [Amycolatopsis thailandensis]|uniref:3,4-dihydroxy-2-butanone-4-phosphate synthase n=1 Tax=Amycolatopsis thailandensis TaxID=589330 RepID=A0A229S758_9PSEU|nr:3,4-dihydroxy-2-butanone-4-phosphate synthase [Amycolatopsis thailandensis]OXM54655.1 3,4-dihydroxy-2-butanone 4-phosphate synthase [Amycolatopsis thailandensis]